MRARGNLWLAIFYLIYKCLLRRTDRAGWRRGGVRVGAVDPVLNRRADHTTWHGPEIVGEILVENVARSNTATVVWVAIAAGGGEVIRGQCVAVTGVKGDW